MVLPILNVDKSILLASLQRELLLQVFRSCFLSFKRAAGFHVLSNNLSAASMRAGRVADDVDQAGRAGFEALAYAEIIEIAFSAAESASLASKSASDRAIYFAHDSTYKHRDIFWQSVSADARWLQENDDLLIIRSLWLQDVREGPSWTDDEKENENYVPNIPPWIAEPLAAFENSDLVKENPAWKLWADWYRALIPDNPDGIIESAFGEQAELAIAQLPPSFWGDDVEGRTPDAVMTDLAKIVADHPSGKVRNQQTDIVQKLLTDDATATDELGRAPFAKELVRRLRDEADSDVKSGDGFAMHLHAPWGAGKSSILRMMWHEMDRERSFDRHHGKMKHFNSWQWLGAHVWRIVVGFFFYIYYFICDLLSFLPFVAATNQSQSTAWIVVDFNAWEHQRRKLPWWPMIEEVRRAIIERLDRDSSHFRAWRIRENWLIWKLASDWLPILIVLLAGIVMIILILINSTDPENKNFIVEFLNEFKSHIAVATTLLGAVGAFTVAGRALTFGSNANATFYQDLSNDPLMRISNLFCRMVRTADRPICIFIDDLDRCSADYVVTLLEGIQTSFRDKNVFYVVAADRAWIRSSFRQRYEKFADHVGSDGQPIGYLFLEKLFQVSTPIPGMGGAVRERYWNSLLRSPTLSDGPESDIDREITDEPEPTREEIDARVEAIKKKNPGGITGDIAREGTRDDKSPVTLAAYTEALTLSTEGELELTHILAEYRTLLPDNPRVMKRMINAFAFRRLISLLEGADISTEVLARWTILEQQFPAVADLLTEDPASLDELGRNYDIEKRRKLPRALWPFNDDTHLRKVIDAPVARSNGGDDLAILTKQDVAKITGGVLHDSKAEATEQ